MKKKIINLLLYGIAGYILFNLIFGLTEVIILKCFNVNKNIFYIFIDNFAINLSIYIIVYFLIVIILYFYDKHIVKKLNDKLNKMRERGNTNE